MRVEYAVLHPNAGELARFPDAKGALDFAQRRIFHMGGKLTIRAELSAEEDEVATADECRAAHPYPDPDPCVMRPDRPHVCLRPDHDERHGKGTPREPA